MRLLEKSRELRGEHPTAEREELRDQNIRLRQSERLQQSATALVHPLPGDRPAGFVEKGREGGSLALHGRQLNQLEALG